MALSTFTKRFELDGLRLSFILFIILTFFVSINLTPLITFFIVTGLITLGLGQQIIPYLRKLKFGQTVREDGPKEHLVKNGTPTMGGIFLILPTIILSLLFSKFNIDVVLVSVLTFSCFLIGFVDDLLIVKFKNNKGLSPKMKLLFQVIFSSLFALSILFFHGNIEFSLFYLQFSLNPFIFVPISVFTITGSSNATNITDGLDGLLAGTTSIFGVLYGTHQYLLGNLSSSIMLITLAGACFGFLYYNSNPAKVFMGDTGSLPIGAMLSGIAILTGDLTPFVLLSIVYVFETLSVIAQVSYFKYTKNKYGAGIRIFKMAPFHHHLQASNLSEVEINFIAYVIMLSMGLISNL
jgi:phospho-N-acetylmuramoyl-pentapeptide-transferase